MEGNGAVMKIMYSLLFYAASGHGKKDKADPDLTEERKKYGKERWV